jgi:hypothetical protein
LNYQLPFMLARGDMQVQIEQTKAALEKVGWIEVARQLERFKK